ncbi:MAG TPA: carboxypeptidase regulatory-like domain-containing protein, partial [Terriglobales bacterium]|nr:carboxypeptidase regulatory-like domain-containing protein [Terriglobales bacterium]
PSSDRYGQIDLAVTDENGQAIATAVVNLQQDGKSVAQMRTGPTGTAVFRHVVPGAYTLVVERQGFYSAHSQKVEIASGEKLPVEVRLEAVREYGEEVEVTAQPSPIDAEQPAVSTSITATDISNIVYPSTRDYRNVMAFIPGVVADSGGQIHLAGSSTQEIQDYIDGFEVSQPAGGALAVRLNPDSLRKIEVRSSRYSARYGKGSGGIADLEVQDGDNKFRYNATDFIPTVQHVKGIHFNNWTPRAYVSGPILRDRLWFDLSHEGEDDLNIVKELPDNADSNFLWRTADLARLRFNVTPGNVLTASALVNLFDSENTGLSPFDPLSVSFNQRSNLYLFTLKDQMPLAKDSLLEFGTGFHRTRNATLPLGTAPYTFLPTGRTGNYYFTDHSISERTQGFSNLFLKPIRKFGNHQFTLGASVDRIIFDGTRSRSPILFLDENNALLRQINFQNVPFFSLTTLESGAYIQDKWSALDRITVEAGARWDHDSFTHRDFYSPRISAAVLAARASETKISGGIGVYYDRTNLSIVSQAFQGSRVDGFVSPQALTLPASFLVSPSQLAMPRFINWSMGIERRLPWQLYAKVDYISRHGNHVWAYEPQSPGLFQLQDKKNDRYDAAQITLRKEFKRGYPFTLAYLRSRAHSNETIGFSLDNFITGNQLAGPLDWDAPNLLQSWGSMPLFWRFKKFDFAYSMLWRSGFPFSTVDQFGRLVQGPDAHRFPDFFTLNPAIERKFNFHGYRWAARIGIDNITNSENPTSVDNNVDSPTFLTFFGQGHRTLNGRIRFLGKIPSTP